MVGALSYSKYSVSRMNMNLLRIIRLVHLEDLVGKMLMGRLEDGCATHFLPSLSLCQFENRTPRYILFILYYTGRLFPYIQKLSTSNPMHDVKCENSRLLKNKANYYLALIQGVWLAYSVLKLFVSLFLFVRSFCFISFTT